MILALQGYDYKGQEKGYLSHHIVHATGLQNPVFNFVEDMPSCGWSLSSLGF